MQHNFRILGIDPGLRHAGWGVLDSLGSRLRFVACGVVKPPQSGDLPSRLAALAEGLEEVLAAYAPQAAAVEETVVNAGARSALKLGQARGVCVLVPARAGLPVAEYTATRIKKSVVGTGRADKTQVAAMVSRLLPGARLDSADAADALAIAICHASHAQTAVRMEAAS